MFKSLFVFAFTGLLTASLCQGKGIPFEEELPFKEIKFVVRDAASGALLSKGVETIKSRNGSLSKNTLYWLPSDKDKIIQEESCSFDLKSLRPTNYKFKNILTGESVELTASGDNLWSDRIVYRESLSKPEETSAFTWQPNLVIGKTLHHVIVRSWSDLVKGGSKSFPLFVPMKRDQFKFRVIRTISESSDRGPAQIISLEPDNWALRQLAPTMLFRYAERGGLPVLERYEGPTTVVVDGDSNRKVVIDFDYET